MDIARRSPVPTAAGANDAALWRQALGRPSDWIAATPRIPSIRPRLSLVGPAAIVASVLAAWFAFAPAGGTVALGLYVGAVAIILMAWSFVLAVRFRRLEPLFGGLDNIYKVHRWVGSLAIPAMFLHARIEPEVDNGIRGAAESLADSAEDLAGVAEYSLYALVAVSLIRWFPYRYWRLTHKLMGIPFVMACFHFITATKTYANNSPWGWYFGAIMAAGVVTYLYRVLGRDVVAPGLRYEITAVERHGVTTEVRLRPKGRALQFKAGQFAVFKLQQPGLREPHVFTIASSPEEDQLRFYIRNLGDWTAKMQTADLVGSTVIIEGPYGTFDPYGHQAVRPVWIAGGVGITPFLSAAASTPPADLAGPPRLIYCVPDRAEASALAQLEQAQAEGRIDLVVMASAEGNRLNRSNLAEAVGAPGLAGAHVAICGPKGLVADMANAARTAGAAHIEHEDFDIRSGLGPDLSQAIDDLVSDSRSR